MTLREKSLPSSLMSTSLAARSSFNKEYRARLSSERKRKEFASPNNQKIYGADLQSFAGSRLKELYAAPSQKLLYQNPAHIQITCLRWRYVDSNFGFTLKHEYPLRTNLSHINFQVIIWSYKRDYNFIYACFSAFQRKISRTASFTQHLFSLNSFLKLLMMAASCISLHFYLQCAVL